MLLGQGGGHSFGVLLTLLVPAIQDGRLVPRSDTASSTSLRSLPDDDPKGARPLDKCTYILAFLQP